MQLSQQESTEVCQDNQFDQLLLLLMSSLFLRLIFKGYKNPLVDSDLWALGKNNKSATIVPKFMEKWAKEEKRCAM